MLPHHHFGVASWFESPVVMGCGSSVATKKYETQEGGAPPAAKEGGPEEVCHDEGPTPPGESGDAGKKKPSRRKGSKDRSEGPPPNPETVERKTQGEETEAERRRRRFEEWERKDRGQSEQDKAVAAKLAPPQQATVVTAPAPTRRRRTKSDDDRAEDENGEQKKTHHRKPSKDRSGPSPAAAWLAQGPKAASDCAWHVANCADAHFVKATTIKEAYSIGEDHTKHEKKQHQKFVQRIGESDFGGRNGKVEKQTIELTKLGPKQLGCDFCGEFILDRQTTKEFRFCQNCRLAGRKLELCMGCWKRGVLDDGTRDRSGGQGNGRRASAGAGVDEESPWMPSTEVAKRRSAADGQFEKLPEGFDPNHDHKRFCRQFHSVEEAYPGKRGEKIKLLRCDECRDLILRRDEDARASVRDDVKSFFVCVHCRDLAPDSRRYELCVKCIVKR